MNLLRKAVAGKKNRIIESDYNLDISYITPRILSMSFPGEGFS